MKKYKLGGFRYKKKHGIHKIQCGANDPFFKFIRYFKTYINNRIMTLIKKSLCFARDFLNYLTFIDLS